MAQYLDFEGTKIIANKIKEADKKTSNKLDKSGGTMTGELTNNASVKVLNVDNPEANVGLNFYKSIPRIRYGGTGNGAANGFQIQGPGDSVKLKIDENGELYVSGTKKVYHEGNKPKKSDVGLSNVDNTSDLNKPISTATQNALNGKANSNHTHNKSQITDMPTKLSQFTNDTGFIRQSDVDTSENHTHSNKSIIDKITQTLLDNWNKAFTHISDTVKHITSAERTLWNTVSNKLDKTANAVSASKLQTARNINGVAFDGTRDITVYDSTKLPLSGGNMTGTIKWVSETSKDLLAVSGSTDSAKIQWIVNSLDNTELRFAMGDDVSTKFSWYGNSTNLMTLQPTGSGTTVNGAELNVAGNIKSNGKILHAANHTTLSLSDKFALRGHDSWLRINEDKAFSSGTYFGSGLVRMDGQFQVGDNGNTLKVDSGTFTYKNNAVYHVGNKPTPAAIGAVPNTGTTVNNPNTQDFSLTNGISGNLIFNNTGNSSGVARGVGGVNGDNDGWTVRGYQTGANAGALEIAVGDDGNEAIYVRQYTPGLYKLPFMNNAGSLPNRQITLMEANTGDTHFHRNVRIPGNLTVGQSTAGIITLALGDTDTGFKWISDGIFEIYSDNIAVARIRKANEGIQVYKPLAADGKLYANGDIRVRNKVDMQYNASTESLDFVFV